MIQKVNIIRQTNKFTMSNNEIANFYERDIRKLIEELNLFKNEENLWKTYGSVNNSSGNLALHIIGGLNHRIGVILAKTNYVRNRDQEFIRRDVERKDLVAQLEELIPMINETVNALTLSQMESDYPIFFDKPNASTNYVLVQLLLHLNYHLGQVNYLRRFLE